MASAQIKKMSWWHESIVDWELANPDKSMGECAFEFGVTETWLSIIRNSDIYREYASRRRSEHNENVSLSIVERVEAVAEVSLDVLAERIDRERQTIGLGVVNNTAEMAIKALGFGARRDGRGGDTQVNVTIGAATPELLGRAREKMRVVNAHTVLDDVGATDALTIDATLDAAPDAEEVEDESRPHRTVPAPS